MNSRKILDVQQKKLKGQDQDVENIIGEVRIGNKLAIGIKDELRVHDKLLDKLDSNVPYFLLVDR